MSAIVTDLVEIAKTDELTSGEMKLVTKQGREFLVARAGDQYYAADNRCPHMGGHLAQGKLNGTVVTCPRHGSQFDLKDGHVVRWTTWPAALVALDQVRSPKRPLNVYPVVVQGDRIMVKLP